MLQNYVLYFSCSGAANGGMGGRTINEMHHTHRRPHFYAAFFGACPQHTVFASRVQHQARAKVELREYVTEQDAKDVVDMMQEVRK